MVRFGRPEIFDHQGSQFTSFSFTNTLKAADISPHLDGRPWPLDGQRLHRAVYGDRWKYECVYLNAFETGSEATNRDRSVDRLLQCRSTPLGLRRQDARRGLCYAGNRGEIGGVIEPRIDLSQAAILSRKAGPPLSGEHASVLACLISALRPFRTWCATGVNRIGSA